jgi:cytochrome c-type biogenesis protein CcmF
VFLMGIGPLARWKAAELPDLWTRLKWALGVSLVTAALLPLVAGSWKPLVSFGLLLALWIVASTVVGVKERIRNLRGGLGARLAAQPRGYWGMTLAHLGVAVFIVGVTLVKGYETERDVRMAVGDTVTVGRYTFRFDGVRDVAGPNYNASRAAVDVSRDGKSIETLYPEKRVYLAQQMPMTEAAIDSGLLGDIYVSLGDPVGDGSWAVRVYDKPFVNWIWFGCILMALGGVLALSDRRYRVGPARAGAAARTAAATAG